MAKHPGNSHGSDAALSRVVDTLIRGLGPDERDAIDAPDSPEQAQNNLATETPPIRQGGDQSATIAHATPHKPSAMARSPRWERRLRRWAWLRVALGVLLGLAVLQWPYGRPCGLPLVGYLGVVTFIVMTAFWAGVHTWKTRLATGHTISLALLAWGAVLAAGEILPRTGYARHEAAWVCAMDGVPGTSAPVPAH